MPDQLYQLALDMLKKGVSPDGEPWRGGPPRISMSFVGPKVENVRQKMNRDGSITFSAEWHFGKGAWSDGFYMDGWILIQRFLEAHPDGERALMKAFERVANERKSKVKQDIQKWFKQQTRKPFSDLVGFREADDWEQPELTKLGRIEFGRPVYDKIKRKLKIPVSVQATIIAKPLPEVAEAPFSVMTDQELNNWIKRWEYMAPENFWMDGEMQMSRPQAYKMYRERWRKMRPREQVNMMKDLGGRRASKASSVSKMGTLLAVLRALHWNHWTSHWQSVGTASYGDHLLFQRLYEEIEDDIDGLAEKAIAQYGNLVVDPVRQADLMAAILKRWAPVEGLVQRAMQAEKALAKALENAITAMDATHELSKGTQAFLEGLADKRETAVYLLGQRLSPTATNRMARRYVAGLRFSERLWAFVGTKARGVRKYEVKKIGPKAEVERYANIHGRRFDEYVLVPKGHLLSLGQTYRRDEVYELAGEPLRTYVSVLRHKRSQTYTPDAFQAKDDREAQDIFKRMQRSTRSHDVIAAYRTPYPIKQAYGKAQKDIDPETGLFPSSYKKVAG